MKLTKIKYLVDPGGGGLHEVSHNSPIIKGGKLNIHFWTSYTMKPMKRKYSVDLYQGVGARMRSHIIHPSRKLNILFLES